MRPDENDNDLGALFGDNESIDVPDPEATPVEALDVYQAAGEVDLSRVEVNFPTESVHSQVTLPPEEVPTRMPTGSSPDIEPSSVEGLPAELAWHPRYRVVRLLGIGGMGAVYQAEHRLMNRVVALKVIHQHFTASSAAAERFRREVRTAARLHHGNIVSAYDAEQAGSLHLLIMEYVEGTNLGEYLRTKGRLPIREACDYVRQAAQGLQHAHAKGMVHRDIKPDNMMRTADGQIKILDFGLARFAQTQEIHEQITTIDNESSGEITLAGSIMGTPDYMAPEQANNSSQVDIRADLYSLGCSLYQLLTGEVPFSGGTIVEKVARHAVDPPPPLTSRCRDIPTELAGIVEKMLAKDPNDRYQTPSEVAEVLAPFIESPAEKRPALAFSRWFVWVVVGVVLGVALFVGWIVQRPR